MKNIKILFFDRIDVSQETDVNKTSASKECAICLNWYFLNKCLKFKPNDCNKFINDIYEPCILILIVILLF